MNGQRIVGCVGNTVPLEAVLAAGAFAVRIAPVDGPAAAADAHIESFTDLDARLIFAQYVSGQLDALDLLLIPRSTENQHKLYLALREAQRTGLKQGGPALWLCDILHTLRPSSRAYGLARTRELLLRLGELTGHAPDAADLARAISLTNETRVQLTRLQALRLAGQVSGQQAQIAAGATRFLAPEFAKDALCAWLDAGVFAPAHGPRLLVKGVPLDHAALHALVDELGACIVQEDDDWGARAGTPMIDAAGDPIEAIFDHYHAQVPCPRIHPVDAEHDWFAEAIRSVGSAGSVRVDAVLFYLPRPDDIHGWRFPEQRARVEQARLPWLLIRDDARGATAHSALGQSLGGFIASLASPPARVP